MTSKQTATFYRLNRTVAAVETIARKHRVARALAAADTRECRRYDSDAVPAYLYTEALATRTALYEELVTLTGAKEAAFRLWARATVRRHDAYCQCTLCTN